MVQGRRGFCVTVVFGCILLERRLFLFQNVWERLHQLSHVLGSEVRSRDMLGHL